MPATREQLEARISAFRGDLRMPGGAVAAATTLCFALCAVAITPAARRTLGLGAWLLFCVSVAAAVVAVCWWGGRLRALRRRHGLVCANCGKFITKTGFRGTLGTSCCEHCNSAL